MRYVLVWVVVYLSAHAHNCLLAGCGFRMLFVVVFDSFVFFCMCEALHVVRLLHYVFMYSHGSCCELN